MRESCFPLFLLLLVFPATQMGWSQESPSGFFQKGYVEGGGTTPPRPTPLQGKSPTGKFENSQRKQGESSLFDGITVHSRDKTLGSGVVDLSERDVLGEASAGALMEETIRGDKVYSLGLLVNGVDKEHLMRHAQTAVDVAAKHNLIISQIAAVGLIQPGKKTAVNAAPLFNSPLSFSVIALDGHFFPLLKMPEEFPVTRSPTWVLNTGKGSVVVEGLEDIGKMLNKNGEYVDKDFASMMAEELQVPTPDPVEIVGIDD